MYINCAKSCNSCNYMDPRKRCTRETLKISDKPLFGPGITTEHTMLHDQNRFHSFTHSRNEFVIRVSTGALNKMLAELKGRLSDKYTVNVLSTAPYVATIDNFLTDGEIDSVLSSLAGWQEPQLRGGDESQDVNLDEHKARAPHLSWCSEACLEVIS